MSRTEKIVVRRSLCANKNRDEYGCKPPAKIQSLDSDKMSFFAVNEVMRYSILLLLNLETQDMTLVVFIGKYNEK